MNLFLQFGLGLLSVSPAATAFAVTSTSAVNTITVAAVTTLVNATFTALPAGARALLIQKLHSHRPQKKVYLALGAGTSLQEHTPHR